MKNNDAAMFYAGYEVNNDSSADAKFINKPVFQITLFALCCKVDKGVPVKSLQRGLLTLRHIKKFQSAGSYHTGNYRYLCLFEEEFLPQIFRENLKRLHLFTKQETREVVILGSVYDTATQLFIKVIAEQYCDYHHKYDLIRIYITQLLHLAMKTDTGQ